MAGREENLDTYTTIAIEPRERADHEQPGSVGLLVCLNGTNRGWTFVLPEGRNVIGTNADCDVVVTDRSISGRHATVSWTNGEWALTDLDSRNGTWYLADRLHGRVGLVSGDRFVTGRTAWRFFYANLK